MRSDFHKCEVAVIGECLVEALLRARQAPLGS